jgi:hypothetical protein
VGRHIVTAFRVRRDPYDNLEEVISLDQMIWCAKHPWVSPPLFFFQCGAPGDETAGYRLGDRVVRRAINTVRASGAGAGLHASLAASRTPGLLGAERFAISAVWGKEIDSNRHHFLALREPADGHALAAAGIRHDYTLGFADVAGFRLGTCRPFPLFDPESFSFCGVTEHPLGIMECTLFWERYMGLGDDEAFDYCLRLARATAAHRGELVLLWHNTELLPLSRARRLYVRLLDGLAKLVRDGVDDSRRGAT